MGSDALISKAPSFSWCLCLKIFTPGARSEARTFNKLPNGTGCCGSSRVPVCWARTMVLAVMPLSMYWAFLPLPFLPDPSLELFSVLERILDS